MSGKASSSQSTTGFGSGGLSHVYIQHQPLHCSIRGSRGLFYDDGTKLLISTTSNQVISWKTVPFSPFANPTTDSISEGPILAVRFSLDEKLIAVQRSNSEIQFWLRETGEAFNQKCKSESESILGFFWTDCPLCDIVVIKNSGLDLYAFDLVSKTLILVETRKLNVSWYVYTHESRLVLLASGMQCKTFNGFQLSSAGIIRLPKFEMVIAKSEANSKPVLADEDVFIVTIYGRIYCLQIDRISMLLHCYRFYRDAVVQQGSLPIYSSKVAISVVDNVLLVHQVDAKVVILYDIFSDSQTPISAPLPVLLRGLPRSNSLTSQSNGGESESSETSNTNDHETIIYGDDWKFLVPDLICDVANKLLWKIHIDLEAIAASSSEVPSVLEFLQRRKLEANKAKQLCLAITRTVILECRPVPMVAKAMDAIVSSYSLSIKTGSFFKGIKVERSLTGVPNVNSTGSGTDVPTSRTDGLGKSIKYESNSRYNSGLVNRSSSYSASDSEDNGSSEPLKTISDNTPEAQPSSLQSQPPGPINNLVNPNVSEQQETQLATPAISPDEMYKFVFAAVEEEMVEEPSYLVAILLEFLRSANVEKVKVHPNIYVLTIQLLACSDRYAELGLFIINKILEPSKEVAFQLLELGRENLQTRKLGLDMLRQLSLHHDYVLLLVQDGYYLEALRYVRKHKVTGVRPLLFLEAAFASNDSQHLAAVLRFFSDFIPGFQSTTDFCAYHRVLGEMNGTITV
ncbi:hypothetical protein SLEP1_g35257 [Rubroshorea leprosula]|uniref:Mic1 domain-containing protein n=1 Tax=Rubroshorea leprosula TaxID=152421 RepID=A0AAV5KMX0_9ROSI|nr:hypothetical protein SLEP1_g35257 [Rubroshorea leprosula]